MKIARRIHLAVLAARLSLGLVWVYEGLVPKILFLDSNPEQMDLVLHHGLWWGSPQATLVALGVAQAALGLAILSGWRARATTALATAGMLVLIVLVASGRPEMLTDPFGALAKDLCLTGCAAVVWLLAPVRRSSPSPGQKPGNKPAQGNALG